MFRIKTYALLSVIALACAAGGYVMTSSNTGLAAGHGARSGGLVE